MPDSTDNALLWWRKWKWYERNSLPWNRFRIHRHMLRRRSFIRFPIQGNVLECLDDGRLEVGPHTLFEPGCWITISDGARITIGEGCFLNLGTMLAAIDRIEIGDHVMFANHCFVGDAAHRYDDPDMPITWQGFTSKGPVKIGSNCWLGVNCVVTSGVTIGDRCVIGSNSVVTRDLPSGVIAAGAPARIIKEIEFRPPAGDAASRPLPDDAASRPLPDDAARRPLPDDASSRPLPDDTSTSPPAADTSSRPPAADTSSPRPAGDAPRNEEGARP